MDHHVSYVVNMVKMMKIMKMVEMNMRMNKIMSKRYCLCLFTQLVTLKSIFEATVGLKIGTTWGPLEDII